MLPGEEDQLIAWRHAVLVRVVLALALTAPALGAGAFARGPLLSFGTPEEHAVCRRDAARFCRRIGDPEKMLACLQANRLRVSEACRAFLVDHGV
jgi:hypothetical protein